MMQATKQRGVALIVALVILLPLMLIAVTVMQSSSMSLKMAGSGASFQRSQHMTEGGLDAALAEINLSSTIATIATLAAGVPKSIGDPSIPTAIKLQAESVCKRKFKANSQNVTPACRYAEATASNTYGKTASQITFTAGVEQPLLKAN
ncbi:pilus assembly PilX N-terminal domain-containing protein [Aeromonas caviae]|jgi:type IV pilus assembly protein PilX|uniref:pilus assembly PilX family protein n=1 Tax=Aeromonas caviae TaxID=648 RepID=UPI002B45B151|nr:pilus assembly PilX N-terminal domain-containing protein [Aeromonas caviae]